MNPAALRERYLRLREEAGPNVTVVVATKYVSLDDLAILAEAGVEVVGENRAQDLQAKHARYGEAFRWRDRTASAPEVERARGLFVAFGSCSFDEPVDDLVRLGLLAA